MTVFLGPIFGDKERLEAIANWVSGASNLDEAQEYDYGDLSTTTEKYAEADYENLDLNRTGIFGLPFQFNNYADVPMGSMYPGTKEANKYVGRVFEEHIFANMPIVYFEVGRPLFMDTLSGDKSTTSWVMKALTSASSLANGLTFGDASLDTVFEKSSLKNWLYNSTSQLRYYGFKDDFLNYAEYVNSMARFVAIKMGIGDSLCMLMGEEKRYRDFDIKQIKNRFLVTNLLNCLANTATSYHVPLYCTASGTSVSENASNTVGESMLSSTIKNGSQLAKEISFLFNTALPEVTDEAVKGITDLVEGLTGGFSADGALGFIKKIGTVGKTIVNSANMMFPAIWQDSTFTKTYNITAKFSTPYGDAYSIFNDVYVPFLCILAMSLPRQNGSAGYGSPFIIKAHSKGYFNCDMGIVESLEIKRGGETNNEWSYNGLPTSIEVSISIKDLYPAIVATQAKGSTFMFAGNSGLIDYLNMMAGLNLTALDPFSNIDAGVQMILSDVYNIWGELGYTINHKIYSNLKYISDGFFS